jgi:hypothetical protein
MNIDNESNQPLQLAENMKRFPFRVPSAKDFDLDGWKWQSDFIPDDLVRLYQYKQELFYDSIAHNIRTNESRPSAVMYSQLMSEFDIDMERLELFLFAGSQVAYERELNAMTDEELAEHMEFQQMFSEAFDDKDGLGGALDEIVERVKQESDEREALENLWKEGE